MRQLNRSTKSTINLSNSVIGVSLLAMPLCFKQCGVILSLVLILLSVTVNRFSCYLLLKSAIVNRRRNYEVLAFDVFGVTGKRFIEISILLFLLGTCIAFFVVLGDIASSLVAQIFDVPNSPHVRTLIVTILAMFVIFPLGLLRNVDNLTSFSMVSLFVYSLLALTMLMMFGFKFNKPTSVHLFHEINYWNSANVVSYLPIFSMALSCQSQLFEIFQLELYQDERGSFKLMMHSTVRALKMCAIVYSFIGLFGYLAFYDLDLSGNVLQMLPAGFVTRFTLLLFMITILTSFPLCLFPSRTSLHSLLFRKAGYHDLKNLPTAVHMSDFEFKIITIFLIITTLGISILFPHVELILALVGSTIGTLICFILPGMIFIKLSDKNTLEYLMSFLLIFFGIIIMVFCTFSAVQKISVAREIEVETKIKELKQQTIAVNLTGVQAVTPSVPFSKSEFKAKIHDLSKLKESIQKDISNFQKKEDEELLHKLEKQQNEQSKIIQEQAVIIKELSKNVKKLNEETGNSSKIVDATATELKKSPVASPVNATISVKIITPKLASNNAAVDILPPSPKSDNKSSVENVRVQPPLQHPQAPSLSSQAPQQARASVADVHPANSDADNKSNKQPLSSDGARKEQQQQQQPKQQPQVFKQPEVTNNDGKISQLPQQQQQQQPIKQPTDMKTNLILAKSESKVQKVAAATAGAKQHSANEADHDSSL